MSTDEENFIEYLKGFQDPSDRARVIRAAGLESCTDPETAAYVQSQAALGAGLDGKILSAIRGGPKTNRAQRRAEKRAQRHYDRSRMRPQYQKAYGDASLAHLANRPRPPLPNEAAVPAAEHVNSPAECEADAAREGALAPALIDQAKPRAPRVSIDPILTKPARAPKPGTFEDRLYSGMYETAVQRAKDLCLAPPERPAWYTDPSPGAGLGNPFMMAPAQQRSSSLTPLEGRRLFEAVSFCKWRYGAPMSAHIVILWETFGVHDHGQAARLFGKLMNRARKWAAVGTPGQPRRRRRQRSGEGFSFHYVFVHECAPERGFHSHVLATVPRFAKPDFTTWLQKSLERLTNHPGDRRSVRVIRSNARDEDGAVRRSWGWFRYISKQLDPRTTIADTPDAPARSAREVLKLWPFRTALPVTCMKISGCSEDIGPAAQKQTGFRSALRFGDLDQIYSGWELEAGRQHRDLEEILPALAR